MRRSEPLTQRADIGAELPATSSDILRLVSVRRRGHVGIGTTSPAAKLQVSGARYGVGHFLQLIEFSGTESTRGKIGNDFNIACQLRSPTPEYCR